ncbi:MAG: S26 family signal peptidase [Hyphomonadaceae bacterium JAD_PAG50586_4]|nr:MAG: S26 family signal peptidase [Hyphomonadaceae bacterium JAD_PAG50586_4]
MSRPGPALRTPLKRGLLAVALIVGVFSVITAWRAQRVLIYNPSDSVPSGFYLRSDDPLSLGSFATVAAIDVAPEYAAMRGYDDHSDFFLKRVRAIAGQQVCGDGQVVSIDGVQVAVRNTHDEHGRVLPTWEGCRTLAEGEVFLLGDTEDSFDGRYWGPTLVSSIEAAWRPL